MALRNKLPERYPDIIAMYAKGSANSLELLKTDFGHWPPNGLDIVNAPNIDIQFKSVFSTKYGLERLKPSWFNLLVSLNLLKSYPVSAVAYIAVSAFLRGIELGGFVDVHKNPERIHLNDMYRLFGFFRGGRRFLSHIISHEFKHVVQARDDLESLSSSLEDRRNIRDMRKANATKMERYLLNECELQARLHTVIVGLYHQHEMMPLSKADLLGVLFAQGLEVPNEILFRYVNKNTEQKWQRDDELYNRYADKSAISDLNKAVSALKPERKAQFFSEILPFIYGDLLELYGDRQGQKRMGHTHNIQLREIFYRSGLEHRKAISTLGRKHNNEAANTHREKALAVIDKMDTEDAVDLACNIARGNLYHEYGKAELISVRSALGLEAVKRVFRRSDLEQPHKSMIREAFTNSPANEPVVVKIIRSGLSTRRPRKFTAA